MGLGLIAQTSLDRIVTAIEAIRTLTTSPVLPSEAATSTIQTDGTQKSIVRGGAKGATTAADITGTAVSADHQAIDVHLATALDEDYDSVATIDWVHKQIHEGRHFTATEYDVDTDTGASPKVWRITAPNTAARCHLDFEFTCGASGGKLEMYIGSTINGATPGTALNVLNNDGNSATVNTVVAFKDSVNTSNGTLFKSWHIGTSGGSIRLGGGAATRREYIMLQNSTATFVFTPVADNTISAINLEWYEV